jgi:hypothetical protein
VPWRRRGSRSNRSPCPGPTGRREHHGREDRADERLEQVGAHAGHVADVVAHVVGDDRGVAGVVLGDTGLDLADEVRSHVGSLGVDAAADTREQRDRAEAPIAKPLTTSGCGLSPLRIRKMIQRLSHPVRTRRP